MGDATSAELNAVDAVFGYSFLLDYGNYATAEPELMKYLLSRGLRLDAATHSPSFRWCFPGLQSVGWQRNELRP